MSAKPRLVVLLCVILGVICFGTVGYMLVERWSFLDALFMTIITISSVGFGEVRPLDLSGKVFTILLIAAGIATIAASAQALVMRIVDANLFGDLRKRRLQRRMRHIKDHIILCGYGRVGRQVAAGFREHGETFVLIDREIPNEVEQDPQILVIRGDATDENVLMEAGIERARTVVTVVGSDADNLFIIMTARGLNPKASIVSRAADKNTEVKMRRAGADKVICPYEIGGRRIVSFVLEPHASEFLDSVTSSGNIELRLTEVLLEKGSVLHERPLGESGIRDKSGAIVLAVKQNDGNLITNPDAKVVLHNGDALICLGTTAQLEKMRGIAGKENA